MTTTIEMLFGDSHLLTVPLSLYFSREGAKAQSRKKGLRCRFVISAQAGIQPFLLRVLRAFA